MTGWFIGDSGWRILEHGGGEGGACVVFVSRILSGD